MPIETVSVAGLRGFSAKQSLRLAAPDGEAGSGLTVLVGPNGGGKSTIIEAFRALASRRSVSFSDGKRNKLADDRVAIAVVVDSKAYELRTVDRGGSETVWVPERPSSLVWYILPSRRVFNPYFGEGENNREMYISNQQLPNTRGEHTNEFSQRLFHALRHREEFDSVMGRVVRPVPEWTIDRSDQGAFFIKVNADGQYHNSDGLGEGIVSLLFIIDAVYESRPNDLIVVDEPELSLHPALQGRLLQLLAEYARDAVSRRWSVAR
ncbi:MAG: AAA family ATPase [Chloroflexi bacterium]|nr:AAA family ATPase [Chloroflexota bacterium]